MVTMPTSTNAKQCFHTTQPFVSSFLFTVTEQRKQHGEGNEEKEEKEWKEWNTTIKGEQPRSGPQDQESLPQLPYLVKNGIPQGSQSSKKKSTRYRF